VDWLGHLLSQWALAEVAPGRLVPWLPVAFGFGIVGYFTADREPAWWAACARAAWRLFGAAGRPQAVAQPWRHGAALDR
jgi:competence protein ComEC